MVTLLCRGCGQEVQVVPSTDGRPLRCPKCEAELPASATRQAMPSWFPGATSPSPDTANAAQATLVTGTPASYPFLAPPHGPGEIGWLGPYRILDLLGQGGMGV